MQRLSFPTKTVLSYKITRSRIVLSFKDSPRKSLEQQALANVGSVSVKSKCVAKLFKVECSART